MPVRILSLGAGQLSAMDFAVALPDQLEFKSRGDWYVPFCTRRNAGAGRFMGFGRENFSSSEGCLCGLVGDSSSLTG